jgi:hypothetical protein
MYTEKQETQINEKINDIQTKKFRQLLHRQNRKLCAFPKTKYNFSFVFLGISLTSFLSSSIELCSLRLLPFATDIRLTCTQTVLKLCGDKQNGYMKNIPI